MIDTGILEDDFCENLRELLEAGNRNEAWGIRKFDSRLPISPKGPFPQVFIEWSETTEGDTGTVAYPTFIYDVRVKCRVILVLSSGQMERAVFSNRKYLRLMADYIKINPTINGYCNTISPPRMISGEQLFANTGGMLVADGAIEFEAVITHQKTQES